VPLHLGVHQLIELEQFGRILAQQRRRQLGQPGPRALDSLCQRRDGKRVNKGLDLTYIHPSIHRLHVDTSALSLSHIPTLANAGR
jgi:hypothetical protein